MSPSRKRATGKTYREHFPVRSSGRIYLVAVHDVEWIEADRKHVHLHLKDAMHTLRTTLSKVEGTLDPRHFRRIHRSTIVNLRHVAELQPWFRGDCVVVLRRGTKLTMSRTHRRQMWEFFS